ncbi:translation initiation factor IF-2 [bacterium BMS3Bbin11]|nr:translation initiation factor IF-2 [bacterium BMS3Abin11]GBE45376.1 translation initiation factor IF-2 [bacterium BMS3Bbin11]
MSETNIKSFAQKIGVEPEHLLKQLTAAGVKGKKVGDDLTNDEKILLLKHLSGDVDAELPKSRNKITLSRRTSSEIRQTSRTGSAHAVQVVVRKKRTFLNKGVIDEVQAKEEEKLRLEREAEERKQAEINATKEAEILAKKSAEEEAARARAEAEAEVSRKTEAKKAAKEKAIKAANVDSTEETKKSAGPRPGKQAPAKKDKSARHKDHGGFGKGREQLHVAPGKGKRRKPRRRGNQKVQTSISDQHVFEKPTEPVIYEVEIPETITVADLAAAMSVKAGEVIKVLMGMGMMVTINQILDSDTATLLVEEMGHIAKEAKAETPEDIFSQINDGEHELKPRYPIVTVMGHVDHGKTSLLDYIRETRVASGEAGGITQHIGAYHVETHGGMTFLDTPGHEAFSAMRARGAGATDIVIIVVAADDGVKPQTIEAIHHARTAGVPIVIAINKIDKEGADPERVKSELSSHDVFVEDYGGDVMSVAVSAHTGEGVDALLESVLLTSEILELQAPVTGPMKGMVVEARLDKGRGPVATVLVQSGTLHKGDIVIAGQESGKVRAMYNDAGRVIKQAGPSIPVELLGLSGVPTAGDEVLVASDERQAREIAMYRKSKAKESKLARQQASKLENIFQNMEDSQSEKKTLNLLVKADVQGSVEALSQALEKMSSDEVKVIVVHGMVGGISESDVNLALASEAIIIAFNVRADMTARKLIENEGVEVYYYKVIYDAVDQVKAAIEGMLSPEIKETITGLAEVRDVFMVSKVGAIAGCMVIEGSIKRNNPVRVLRDNVVIFEGKLDSLRRFKEDVNEVKSGLECGIGVKNYNDIKVGDQIEVFEVIETKRTLD